jgi:iron-sulfur cluster insertion protein
LGVVGGGCAGFNYDMFYSEGTTDRDRVIVSNDVSLVVDEASLMYLVGTTVDYITNLKGSGFTFNNPNAKSTCGCAMSFTV